MDKCSFCGRAKNEANMLIAGIEGHICDHCIEQAHNYAGRTVKER